MSEVAPEAPARTDADIERSLGEKIIGRQSEAEPEAQPTPEEAAPPEPDAPAPDSELEPDSDAAFRALAEKKGFTSVDDLVQSYENLERRLTEQTQPEPEFAEPEEQPYQLTENDLRAFDELVEDDPQKAAQLAVQIKDDFLYERAIDAWAEEDEFKALRFDNAVQRQREMEHFQGDLMNQLTPALRMAQNQDWIDSWGQVKQNAPDLDNYRQGMIEVMRENPAITKALGTAVGKDREQLLGLLYHAARSRLGTHATPTTQTAPGPPTPETTLPHVASGETGRDEPQSKVLDEVQYAIRQSYANEPII